MKRLLHCLRFCDGTAAIDVVYVLPILLALTVGALEIALLTFDYQKVSEAARIGARAALVAPAVADLDDLAGGEIVCSGRSGVSCSRGAVASSAGFAAIVRAIQEITPQIEAANIEVVYADRGLDADGIGAMPAVTVRITDVEFEFLAARLIPGLPARLSHPGFGSTGWAVGTAAD